MLEVACVKMSYILLHLLSLLEYVIDGLEDEINGDLFSPGDQVVKLILFSRRMCDLHIHVIDIMVRWV